MERWLSLSLLSRSTGLLLNSELAYSIVSSNYQLFFFSQAFYICNQLILCYNYRRLFPSSFCQGQSCSRQAMRRCLVSPSQNCSPALSILRVSICLSIRYYCFLISSTSSFNAAMSCLSCKLMSFCCYSYCANLLIWPCWAISCYYSWHKSRTVCAAVWEWGWGSYWVPRSHYYIYYYQDYYYYCYGYGYGYGQYGMVWHSVQLVNVLVVWQWLWVLLCKDSTGFLIYMLAIVYSNSSFLPASTPSCCSCNARYCSCSRIRVCSSYQMTLYLLCRSPLNWPFSCKQPQSRSLNCPARSLQTPNSSILRPTRPLSTAASPSLSLTNALSSPTSRFLSSTCSTSWCCMPCCCTCCCLRAISWDISCWVICCICL